MLISALPLLNRRRWRYQWRYMRGKTPWDDGSTPSEVIDFIDTHPPGRAIDLGCGSGTHALTLAEKGWTVTGIDFAPQAIRIARRRAVEKGLETIFVNGDVTCPGCLDGGPYDFALDVGCLFALKSDERAAYAGHLSRLLKSGAWYLLFAWLPRFVNGRPWGISPEGVDLLLASHFKRTRMTIDEEKGVSAAWYWYCRR